MEENTSIPVPRRAARVILLDPAGRVLLICYMVGDFTFWATPGGAVERDEDDRTAAARELYEELRIVADLRGPVHHATGRFHHEGLYVENTDIFFVAYLAHGDLVTYGSTDFEADCMKEARWWTTEELNATVENVFPRDLPGVLDRLQSESN